MSKENKTIVVAEKNGKVRHFSKATWDMLPVGKMGYTLKKDLPELKEVDSKKQTEPVAKNKEAAKVEKKPKHPAFEKAKKDDNKSKKVEETPEEVKEETTEQTEPVAVDPLLDVNSAE